MIKSLSLSSMHNAPIWSPVGVLHNMRVSELMVLNHFLVEFGSKGIFELGGWNGRTTMNLAGNSVHGARVVVFDLPDIDDRLRSEGVENLYLSGFEPMDRKVTRVYGDSGEFDFRPYFGHFDFVLVDGAHDDHVIRDTVVAFGLVGAGVDCSTQSLSKTKNGSAAVVSRSVIFWHDYCAEWPKVVRCLDDVSERGAVLYRVIGTNLCMWFGPGVDVGKVTGVRVGL